MPLLELNHVAYAYGNATPVFTDLTWTFEPNILYAITGRSGAGKTTLLSLLAGLTNPTAGSVWYDGHDLARLDRYRYRRENVGVVFQSYNLLPHLTAVENVELSMRAAGKQTGHKRPRALALLERVGLDKELATRRILKLSGGEQQRVAIARALSVDPTVILADEPTGNLDVATQTEILDMLADLADEGKCVIVVTHSPDVVECVDKVYKLQSGTVKLRRPRAQRASEEVVA